MVTCSMDVGQFNFILYLTGFGLTPPNISETIWFCGHNRRRLKWIRCAGPVSPFLDLICT